MPRVARRAAPGVPFIGSHLLGAFVAGMVWVNVPRSHQIWQAQLKRVVRWMMRVFFACTVGFAVYARRPRHIRHAPRRVAPRRAEPRRGCARAPPGRSRTS